MRNLVPKQLDKLYHKLLFLMIAKLFSLLKLWL
jgi:hypothetical protein